MDTLNKVRVTRSIYDVDLKSVSFQSPIVSFDRFSVLSFLLNAVQNPCKFYIGLECGKGSGMERKKRGDEGRGGRSFTFPIPAAVSLYRAMVLASMIPLLRRMCPAIVDFPQFPDPIKITEILAFPEMSLAAWVATKIKKNKRSA